MLNDPINTLTRHFVSLIAHSNKPKQNSISALDRQSIAETTTSSSSHCSCRLSIIVNPSICRISIGDLTGRRSTPSPCPSSSTSVSEYLNNRRDVASLRRSFTYARPFTKAVHVDGRDGGHLHQHEVSSLPSRLVSELGRESPLVGRNLTRGR